MKCLEGCTCGRHSAETRKKISDAKQGSAGFTGQHTDAAKRRMSATKRAASGRSTEPLVPQLCACGCGEYAAVDEHRNRVSKYRSGHSSKVSPPRLGQSPSQATRDKLASYTGPQASSYKHGWSRTPTYKSWRSMISRCYEPGNASFPHYGGRRITVSPEWRADFLAFLADMGPRPSLDHSIDRFPDRRGNYEKTNCRWATKQQQNDNRDDPGGWITRRANQG